MISIPGSLSFAKVVMMSSATAKSAGDARYAPHDPFVQSTLSHTILTSICIRSAFLLRQTQLMYERPSELCTQLRRLQTESLKRLNFFRLSFRSRLSYVNRELKQRRRRRQRKRHLKIYLYFICATSRLFQLAQLLQKWRTIQELNW